MNVPLRISYDLDEGQKSACLYNSVDQASLLRALSFGGIFIFRLNAAALSRQYSLACMIVRTRWVSSSSDGSGDAMVKVKS